MEMSVALTKVLPRQCWGNTRVCFIYAKRAVNEKTAGCGGKQQSPQGGAFSRDLLNQKSKSLLFPGPGGPWLQMTSALCLHQVPV